MLSRPRCQGRISTNTIRSNSAREVGRNAMSTTLGPSSRPLLSPHARIIQAGDDVEIETGEATYTYSEDSAGVFTAVKAGLDGLNRIEDLAKNASASPEELAEILQVLADDNLLIDTGAAHEARSPDEFLEAYLHLCRFWTRDIFANPFWKALLEGSAPRNVVLGWGMEFYHYVNSANEHMAQSVAHCRTDKTVQHWLAKHYVEEYDHSEI